MVIYQTQSVDTHSLNTLSHSLGVLSVSDGHRVLVAQWQEVQQLTHPEAQKQGKIQGINTLQYLKATLHHLYEHEQHRCNLADFHNDSIVTPLLQIILLINSQLHRGSVLAHLSVHIVWVYPAAETCGDRNGTRLYMQLDILRLSLVRCTSVATAEAHWFLNSVDSLSLCINAFSQDVIMPPGQCPMRGDGLPMENLLIECMDIIFKRFVSHSCGRQMHSCFTWYF